MAGDPGARRGKRLEKREQRLETMAPDTPFQPIYHVTPSRHQYAGSAVADRVMRFAFGFSPGMALAGQLTLGMPESGMEFSNGGIVNVPLIQFGFLGFAIGLVSSPLALLCVRHLPKPKYLLRGGFAVGAAVGFLLALLWE